MLSDPALRMLSDQHGLLFHAAPQARRCYCCFNFSLIACLLHYRFQALLAVSSITAVAAPASKHGLCLNAISAQATAPVAHRPGLLPPPPPSPSLLLLLSNVAPVATALRKAHALL